MTNDQNQPGELNRRDFLQRSSLATLMTMIGAVELVAQPKPEDELTNYSTSGEKVKCAVIGLGPWGRETASTIAKLAAAKSKAGAGQLVAGCDVYPAFLKRLANIVADAELTEDYHKVLDNKEIKAVIIATPSHKHREIA